MNGNPEACNKFRFLKQEYESALREEALYECGGAATLRQAIHYKNEAITASAHARDRLITHYKDCSSCTAERGIASEPGSPVRAK
jgi:hypothetical protein